MDTNNIIRRVASNIEAKLTALEVGESCQHACFPRITRESGQNRFTVAGDAFTQKASEAAFNAAAAGLDD